MSERDEKSSDRGQLVVVDDVSGEGTDWLSSLHSLTSFLLLILAVFGFKDFILDANNIPSGSMIPTLKIGDYLFVNKMRYSLRLPFLGNEVVRIDEPRRGDIITFIPPRREKHYVKRVMAVPGDRIRMSNVPACELPEAIRSSNANEQTPDALAPPDSNLERDYECGGVLEPQVMLVEYKENDTGEWRNYGVRELSASQGREILMDADDPQVLDASANPYQAGDLSVAFEEYVNGVSHLIVERSRANATPTHNDFCDSIATTGCIVPAEHYLAMGDNRDNSQDSRAIGYIPRERILGKALIIYVSVNWYDEICANYRQTRRPFFLPDFTPEDQERYCLGEDGPMQDGGDLFSTIAGYGSDLIQHRIPRMSIRWDRIGTLLE